MAIKDVSAALSKLNGATVEIGWFSSNRYNTGVPVAAVAAWNELGTEKMPSRPFMRKAIADGNESVGALVAHDMNSILQGNLTADQHLHRIGMHYESAVVESIVGGSWVPNSESTIKRKGFDAPLRDTKIMMQTVTHEISMKE